MSSLIDLCLAEPSLKYIWNLSTDVGFGIVNNPAMYGTEVGYDMANAHYISMGANWSTLFNGSSAISILIVYRRGNSSVEEGLFTLIGAASNNTMINFGVSSANENFFYVRSRATDTNTTNITTGASITAGANYQLGGVVDYVAKTAKTYKNGAESGSWTSLTNLTQADYSAVGDATRLDMIGANYPTSSPGNFIRDQIYLAAVFSSALAASKWTAFNAATKIAGSARWRSGDKLATIGDTLSGLADGTYHCTVFDTADLDTVTRIVWNGDITVTSEATTTQVRTALGNGALAYCDITSQPGSQVDQSATNTIAAPLVLNHV